jgi:Zn-finger nucleic acid-binding protein
MSEDTVTTTGRELRCPNCDGRMREVERRGLKIDICTECKGVFLDRGELEALVDALEQVEDYYERQPGDQAARQAPAGAPPPAAPPPAAGGYQPPPAPGGYQPPPAPPGPGGYQAPPPPAAAGYPAQPGYPGQHGQPRRGGLSEAVELFTAAALQHKMGRSGHYGHKRKKRKGLLGDLFDFDL